MVKLKHSINIGEVLTSIGEPIIPIYQHHLDTKGTPQYPLKEVNNFLNTRVFNSHRELFFKEEVTGESDVEYDIVNRAVIKEDDLILLKIHGWVDDEEKNESKEIHTVLPVSYKKYLKDCLTDEYYAVIKNIKSYIREESQSDERSGTYLSSVVNEIHTIRERWSKNELSEKYPIIDRFLVGLYKHINKNYTLFLSEKIKSLIGKAKKNGWVSPFFFDFSRMDMPTTFLKKLYKLKIEDEHWIGQDEELRDSFVNIWTAEDESDLQIDTIPLIGKAQDTYLMFHAMNDSGIFKFNYKDIEKYELFTQVNKSDILKASSISRQRTNNEEKIKTLKEKILQIAQEHNYK